MLNAYGNRKNHDLLSFFYQKIGTTDPSIALFKATISNSSGIFHILLKKFGHQISTKKKLILLQIAVSRGYAEIYTDIINQYCEELSKYKASMFFGLTPDQQAQIKTIFERKEAESIVFHLPTLDRLKEMLSEQNENEPTDSLMMHLIIKKINMPELQPHQFHAISRPPVKVEKVETPQPAISAEERARDSLLRARQIVASSHCYFPDNLMFHLAKRRIEMESTQNLSNSEEQISQNCEKSYPTKKDKY